MESRIGITGKMYAVEEDSMALMEECSKSATDVRKNWSLTVDTAVRRQPLFIKRTRDYISLLNVDTLASLLRAYKFHLELRADASGRVSGMVDELGIAASGDTREVCIAETLFTMKDFARDFYASYEQRALLPDQQPYIPYVLKLLVTPDQQLYEDMICRDA